MIIISLKEFIRTGNFGPISIGSKKADIINALGEKFDFLDLDETQIIKYGWYEFFYWTETEVLFAIQNDHLQADCTNHKEMIGFKNKLWTVDTWFLQENKNIKFEQVEDYLNEEKIPFEIVPAVKPGDDNVIRCLKSKVTFDFANKYTFAERNEKGKIKKWRNQIEEDQSKYVLNGIRLIDF